MFTGSPAEGMQIRPEQEVVPLAEGDAQAQELEQETTEGTHAQ